MAIKNKRIYKFMVNLRAKFNRTLHSNGRCGDVTGENFSDAVVRTPDVEGVSCGRPPDRAIIYRSEFDYISRCILDYPRIETGGQLFGFWSASGVPVVLFAIGPGRRANHQVTFFNQDLDYLTSVGRILVNRYGLQHMGEWHSHHQLGLAHPSGHDASTMVRSIERENLGRFLLCIGNCDGKASVLNAFNFTQEAGYDYRHAAWSVKEVISPFRTLVSSDPDLCRLIEDPSVETARHGRELLVRNGDAFSTPAYSEDYWLRDKKNNLILKQIVDRISSDASDGRCAIKMDDAGCVHLFQQLLGKSVEFVFTKTFPRDPPLCLAADGELDQTASRSWSYRGDIYKSFSDFYEEAKKGIANT